MNLTLRNLLVAAMMMLVGVLLVTNFIRNERRDLSRGKQEVQVFVAAKDIPAGTPAKELEDGGFLETRDVLREDQAPGAIGRISSVRDLVSNETVYKGETLTMNAFDRTTGLKPTAQIKGNERLVSVPINPAVDIGSLIRPGDHVDIHAALPVRVGSDQLFQQVVVARDIEIIETPDSLRPDTGEDPEAAAPEADGDRRIYVLKATDKEVQDILFSLAASDDTKLVFTLRGASGDSETNLNSLLGPAVNPSGRGIAATPAPDPAVR